VNIIIFGPPGAGKGTQANNLVKDFKLYKVSTGDLLRKEIKEKTSVGKEIESTLDRGLFVSDDIINNLIEKILSEKKINNRLIFDGYPRNINQAEKLELLTKKYNQKISCVFSLNVSKDIVLKRILGRLICSNCGIIFNEYFNPPKENHTCEKKFLQKRKDDNEKTLIQRFETYLEKTLPILNFYKELNLLHQINGMAKIDDIYKEIQGIIASLET